MAIKCTWLGQASLLLDLNGITVMVDPYLSDSIGQKNPAKHRPFEVPKKWREFHPDVLILTHDHLDHTDPDSLTPILDTDKPICVLACTQAWAHIRPMGGPHNYVWCRPGTQWQEKNVLFEIVHAEHSDETAIGVVIHGEKKLYITGDTLYNRRLIDQMSCTPDVVFLPINGVGNNMNAADAARLAADLGAHTAIPLHYGLFDTLIPAAFDCPRRRILPLLETVEL